MSSAVVGAFEPGYERGVLKVEPLGLNSTALRTAGHGNSRVVGRAYGVIVAKHRSRPLYPNAKPHRSEVVYRLVAASPESGAEHPDHARLRWCKLGAPRFGERLDVPQDCRGQPARFAT